MIAPSTGQHEQHGSSSAIVSPLGDGNDEQGGQTDGNCSDQPGGAAEP